MASDTRFAVLDLGSTTFQLLVADADMEGSLTPVLRDRVVLNLGRVLAGEGRIPDDVAGRAAETARRLTDLAVRMGADHVVPLATSALRDSPDREALASLLGGAVGTEVRFIDGREEARLTFAGVTASVALGEGSTLLLDLGGGSLEVAVAGPEGLRWGRSLPIGAGRMTGLLVTHDPPTREERKAVRSAVGEAVAPLVQDVAVAEPARCVASGGTAGALARVLAARRWGFPPASLNQYEVTVSELRDLTRELAALSLAERLRVPGVDERRAELLPAGGWILTSAAASFGAKRLVHSEWGLREGAVLDALGLADRPSPTPEHGAYLVENAGLRGFTPDEIAAIASLVRFHRGKDPRPVYPPFAALSDAERGSVVVLVGLLRVAHAIARGPEGDRLEVAIAPRDGGLHVVISGSDNPDAAVAEARSAAGLLERTLGRPIEIGVGVIGRR